MNRRSTFRSPSLLPVAFGLCVLLGSLASEHGLPGLLKAREQSRRLAAEVAALKNENAALRVRVDELTNDPSAIERIARGDFGLVRRDEVVVTVRPAASPKP
jgi:cell division protein FtsB